MRFVFALADKGWQPDGQTRALVKVHRKFKWRIILSLASYYFTRRTTTKALRPEWL